MKYRLFAEEKKNQRNSSLQTCFLDGKTTQLSLKQKWWWNLKYRYHTYFIDTDFFRFESINSADNSVVIWKKFFSLLDVSESDKNYTPQVAAKEEAKM